MILLFVSLFLFSVTVQGGVFKKNCAESFSSHSQELSSQLKSGDLAYQKNALDLLWNYGADNKLIRKSLQYVLKSSADENIRLKAVHILQFHMERADSLDSKVRIGRILEKHFKTESSENIRLELMDFLGKFPYNRVIKGKLIKIIKAPNSSLQEKALEELEGILNFYLSRWNDLLTQLKNSDNRNITKISSEKNLREVREKLLESAEIEAAYYSKSSREHKIFKPLFKIFRNSWEKRDSEFTLFLRGLNIFKKPYNRYTREQIFDLLKIIYQMNSLKIKIINILESHKDFDFSNDLRGVRWSHIYRVRSEARLMNSKIRAELVYIIQNESEINIPLMKKSFDFLLSVFKEDKQPIGMYDFLQDVSRSETRPPPIRRKAKEALERI